MYVDVAASTALGTDVYDGHAMNPREPARIRQTAALRATRLRLRGSVVNILQVPAPAPGAVPCEAADSATGRGSRSIKIRGGSQSGAIGLHPTQNMSCDASYLVNTRRNDSPPHVNSTIISVVSFAPSRK